MKRGSPQPGSLPNGNLRGSLPHDLWQIWDEIKEGRRKMKMKEKLVVEGGLSVMVVGVWKENLISHLKRGCEVRPWCVGIYIMKWNHIANESSLWCLQKQDN